MSVHFTDDEWSLLSELLRIASIDLTRTADRLQSVWPNSAMVERLRQWSESASAFRARIDAR